ncbi:flagellar protein FlgN [Methylocapsa acidiphila]|uniref:flagellar protein FlgN n=1 Tax=Methylocapsa acidiphila TaxID=133552 RepID=UPI0012EC1DF0|nr:flagellar protein FlgN [Methylocapsa acidiphila]
MVEEFNRSSALVLAFFGVVERLERTLEREGEVLCHGRHFALHDFIHEKSYALLELCRIRSAMRIAGSERCEEDVVARLHPLRLQLERNLAVLHLHLRAVGEISVSIARAIQDHESDGTYSVSSIRKGNTK